MGLLICGPLLITRGINFVGSGTDSLRATTSSGITLGLIRRIHKTISGWTARVVH